MVTFEAPSGSAPVLPHTTANGVNRGVFGGEIAAFPITNRNQIRSLTIPRDPKWTQNRRPVRIEPHRRMGHPGTLGQDSPPTQRIERQKKPASNAGYWQIDFPRLKKFRAPWGHRCFPLSLPLEAWSVHEPRFDGFVPWLPPAKHRPL